MHGLILSVPYLLFTGVLLILALAERVYRNNLLRGQAIRFSCVAAYLLFIGLRGYVGTDWYTYRLIFDNIPALFSGGWKDFRVDNILEPGFVLFTSLLKSLWNNYHFFVFVQACIDVLILHVFLKRYVNWYAFGFLVFFVMGGLTMCELFRNARGIGLFLLSLKYLWERKPLPYFGLNLLGMCFHITSIVYLPLYWILHRRWPKVVFIGVLALGNLVFLCRIEFIRPLIEWGADTLGGRFVYLKAQYLFNELFNEPYGLSIGYLERLLTSALVLGFYRKLHRQRETNVLFVNAYVLYTICFFFFSEMRELAARFSLLFIFAYWVLYPALYEVLQVRFNRTLFLLLFFVYSFLKMAGMTAGNILYRYDNLLWGIECYDRRADTFDRYYLNR